jgi:hypothetical protein
MRNRFVHSILVLAGLCCGQAVHAQTPTAQITGRVTDPSDAVISGAKIVVTNTATGVDRRTVSNDEGYYTIPALPPGIYQLDLQMSGFTAISRSGIILAVNQTAKIDFILQIGAVTESLSVQAATPLLDAAEGALGTVVENAKVANLPLSGRNPFDLVMLTPGTQVYGRADLPGNNIPLTNYSTNGGPSMTNEILLDGVPNTAEGRQNEFINSPSVDAVQEFKVQSNSIKAEFGRTGGGVINVSLKSGTNQFHGVVFEFLRNDKLDSNNWFNNTSGQKRPPYRFNQFGGTVGGPIVKDRAFFFFNYEGLRRRRGNTFLFSVPREDMRQGDFSHVSSAAGQPIEIYDPMGTRSLPGGGSVRDPFPGNMIPRNRMDPVASNMLDYWAKPNLIGDPNTGANNFISTAPEDYYMNLLNVRIDHRISQNHYLFGRFSWDEHKDTPPNVFGNVANPATGPQLFTTRNAGVNDTWTINPSTVASFRLGYARLRDSSTPFSYGFDATKLGFTSTFATQQPAPLFPNIQVTGMTTNIGFGASALGPVGTLIENAWPNLFTGQSDVTKMVGRHVIKVGTDVRVYRVDGYQAGSAGGAFSFTPGFTQGPDPTRAGATSGNAFASYLLGTAASGTITRTPSKDTQAYYLGYYIQDDLKVTPQLTLNLGIRYEYESCMTERYDKLTYLDFNSQSSVQSQELGRTIYGGLAYAGVNGHPRKMCDASRNNWGPRFGFAYSAGTRFVVRGGYGISYLPVNRAIFDQQTGYSATTTMVTAVGFTPLNFISNPFPDGLVAPSGNSLGLLTNIGQGISAADRHQPIPYVQQWNIGVQHTLPGNTVVEVAYAGSKGTRLDQDVQWNQMPDQYLVRGNDLLQQVRNPFLGQIPATAPLGQATVVAGQLLRPFPQFSSVVSLRSKTGSSIYHSMQMRVERRFSLGFTFLASYTVGKLIDDGSPGILAFTGSVPGYQDYNNRQLERSVSSQEVPQRFVLSAVYELPFGPGKKVLTYGGIIGKLIGGWQVNEISTIQSGIPLALNTATNPTLGPLGAGTLRPDNNGRSAKLTGATVDRLNRYFDTSVFSQPGPFRFGTTGRTLPDVRGPGTVNLDLSLFKNTRIGERYTLQFRVEAFNSLNDTVFGNPGTTYGSPTFGVITSAAPARSIQFGLKLYY